MNNVYHDHLDVCERCRREPLNLCAEGLRALEEAVLGCKQGPRQGPVPWEALAFAYVLADFAERDRQRFMELRMVKDTDD